MDFAGPIKYLSKSKREMKAYIVLYACCLTRAVYLEILLNLSMEEFIHNFSQASDRQTRTSGEDLPRQSENLRRSGKVVEEDKE